MESIQSEIARVARLNQSAHSQFMVGGIAPQSVFVPDSAAELAAILEQAGREERAVTPWGGGTKMALGNVPERLDWVVLTRKLSSILVYEPADMTLSVQAGATLANVHEVLGEHGQHLPIEVRDQERATIGGIVASALYGPKRLGAGTLRDVLIGIEVAYPDGSVAKAGGMVVKNVSGFDLMRMHHGALGTLGVIVSANFKVLPRPRSERTLMVTLEDRKLLERSIRNVLDGRVRPAACEVRALEGNRSQLMIRLEGRERTTALLAQELAGQLPGHLESFASDESAAFWRDYVDRFRSDPETPKIWFRSKVRPRETLAVFEAVSGYSSESLLDSGSVTASPGLGFVDTLIDATAMDRDRFRSTLERLRGQAARTTVIAAPGAIIEGIDIWGEDVWSLDLMRRLKEEFDPVRVLNPGRYVGRL
jgi:glycolate oxidase FAD binding subunit